MERYKTSNDEYILPLDSSDSLYLGDNKHAAYARFMRLVLDNDEVLSTNNIETRFFFFSTQGENVKFGSGGSRSNVIHENFDPNKFLLELPIRGSGHKALTREFAVFSNMIEKYIVEGKMDEEVAEAIMSKLVKLRNDPELLIRDGLLRTFDEQIELFDKKFKDTSSRTMEELDRKMGQKVERGHRFRRNVVGSTGNKAESIQQVVDAIPRNLDDAGMKNPDFAKAIRGEGNYQVIDGQIWDEEGVQQVVNDIELGDKLEAVPFRSSSNTEYVNTAVIDWDNGDIYIPCCGQDEVSSYVKRDLFIDGDLNHKIFTTDSREGKLISKKGFIRGKIFAGSQTKDPQSIIMLSYMEKSRKYQDGIDSNEFMNIFRKVMDDEYQDNVMKPRYQQYMVMELMHKLDGAVEKTDFNSGEELILDVIRTYLGRNDDPFVKQLAGVMVTSTVIAKRFDKVHRTNVENGLDTQSARGFWVQLNQCDCSDKAKSSLFKNARQGTTNFVDLEDKDGVKELITKYRTTNMMFADTANTQAELIQNKGHPVYNSVLDLLRDVYEKPGESLHDLEVWRRFSFDMQLVLRELQADPEVSDEITKSGIDKTIEWIDGLMIHEEMREINPLDSNLMTNLIAYALKKLFPAIA